MTESQYCAFTDTSKRFCNIRATVLILFTLEKKEYICMGDCNLLSQKIMLSAPVDLWTFAITQEFISWEPSLTTI